jgi:hypothetical protein
MIARAARSVGLAAVTCFAGTILTIIALQSIERRWSLHAILDLGAVVTVMGASAAALICVPVFLLLQRSALVATRSRAALLGVLCAYVTGPVAFALIFDGYFPRTAQEWMSVLATPLSVPFAAAGAAFGAAWTDRHSH